MGVECPKCKTENTSDSEFCKKCATQLRPAEEISITRTIVKASDELPTGSTFADKYRVLGELGRGGMGVVYKAEDLKLKRFVAIKLLPSELSSDEEAKERFIQEAQAAAVLSHPNICTIYEIEEADEKSYIAMEFIEGESLREKTVKSSLGIEEVLDIAIQAASGLEEAHRKGIIHRDIKSANIMVDEKGQAKIMDFGLAKVAGGALITKDVRPMGTVAYMSPEQARGEEVDHRADIWALGVVIYEMMSSHFPFLGDNIASILYNIEHKDPLPIRKSTGDIPVEIEKIINRSLKKKPESRYQSAGEVLKDLLEYQNILKAPELGIKDFKSFIRVVKRPKIAIPAILAIIIIGLIATWFFNRQAKIRWAKEVAIPEIESLPYQTEVASMFTAYKLAEEAEKYIAGDPKLNEIFSKYSIRLSVKTTPPGASIYYKDFSAPEEDWEFVGITPIEDMRFPGGFFRWKTEKSDYETIEVASLNFSDDIESLAQRPLEWILDRKGTIPEGMVRTPGSQTAIGVLPFFFFDKYEVTNRQFREFLNSGGYRNREYWKHKFLKEGRELQWEEAIAEFVDASGRPGPSTWQAGDYPDGKDNYPVSGVSWYEAAAFAQWAGKDLPTVFHWDAAFRNEIIESHFYLETIIAAFSNFGEGPVSVGSTHSLSFSGCFDLAGNVREWCWNDSPEGKSLGGGAWNDATYMMSLSSQAQPFNRAPENGFRCVKYPDKEKIPEEAFLKSLQFSHTRDYYKEKPVSDEEFQKYFKEQFSYEKSALNSKIEMEDDSPEDWILQRISFDASYNGERMEAFLFLPKHYPRPYQTVIFFPGASSVSRRSSKNIWWEVESFDFMIKNGRAVMFPIIKGTYERGDDTSWNTFLRRSTRQYVDFMINVIQDFIRSIDYLETREDIDKEKIAYYGYSWGGICGNIVPAVEDRVKVSILNLAGITISYAPMDDEIHPLMDPFNYVSRVKVPTLILSGEYDILFPYDLMVKPMVDLLGTPDENKLSLIFPSGHHIPKNDLIRESLKWLDKYLGPVNN